MKEFLTNILEVLKSVVTRFFDMLKKIVDQIRVDKIIKYKKYQKRVLNRKKLFSKRKAKYGR